MIILLERIPFIHRYDDPLAALMGNSGHLRVLLRDPLLCVDHNDHHIRPLDRRYRPDDHVVFQILFYLVFAADARCIDEDIFFSVIGDFRVHGIPGCPGNIRYDQPLFPQQPVDEGAFSDIRFPDDRDFRARVLLFRGGSGRKKPENLIQKISDPGTVCRGDRVRIPDSEIIELIDCRFIPLPAVNLIHHKKHRLMASAEHVSDLRVRVDQSLLQICQKQNDIGGIDRNLRLLSHLRKDNITCVRLNTACIDQRKPAVEPFHIRVDPVPGDTRRIFNDGDP